MEGPMSRFPDWISSLKHLVDFTVQHAKLAGDQVLDSLCKLPNLQSIELGYNSCGDQELAAKLVTFLLNFNNRVRSINCWHWQLEEP